MAGNNDDEVPELAWRTSALMIHLVIALAIIYVNADLIDRKLLC